MKNSLQIVTLVLAAIAVFVSGFALYRTYTHGYPPSQVSVERLNATTSLSSASATSSTDWLSGVRQTVAHGGTEFDYQDTYAFTINYSDGRSVYGCQSKIYTESGCQLISVDLVTGEIHTISGLDVGQEPLLAPPLYANVVKYMALVHPHTLEVVDLFNGTIQTVYTAPAKQALGYWSQLPAFIGGGEWVDPQTFKVALYPDDSMETSTSTPTPVDSVSVNMLQSFPAL